MDKIDHIYSLVFSGLCIFLCIMSFSCSWYYVSNETIIGTGSGGSLVDSSGNAQTWFYFNRFIIDYDNGHQETIYYKDQNLTAVSGLFKISLVFLIIGFIGIIVSFLITLFHLKVGHFDRYSESGTAGILSILASILMMVAYFNFIKLPNAFKSDEVCWDNDNNTTYCTGFRGTYYNDNLKVIYAPYFGWWSLLGVMMFSFASSLKTLGKALIYWFIPKF